MDVNRLGMLAQIASWYYEQGLGLSEIAQRIDRSVSLVSRLLREARDLGVVEIRIRHPAVRNGALEEQFAHRFNLTQAYIFSDDLKLDAAASVRRLGQLSSDIIGAEIFSGRVVGVGWGSHVYAVVSALRSVALDKGLVVQVSGSVGSTDPTVDGAQMAQLLAGKLNFGVRTLSAPLIVASEAVAEALRITPSIATTLAAAREAQTVLIGVGSPLAQRGGLRRAGYLQDADVAALIEAGAVGDIIGYHLNANGDVLDTSVNRRIVGIGPDELRAIPEVIVVAHGSEKVLPLVAALRGEYIDKLFSDESTARAMLQAR
jgi:deoxyribonucleoside regulator